MGIRLTAKSKAILADFARNSPKQMERGLKKSVFKISNQMRNEGASNAPAKTGTLRRSITADFSRGGLKGSVGTNVVYARIHDQGGTIRAHEIRPKNGRFLHFWVDGKEVFTKLVRKPSRKVLPYRGKGYLTPAFKKQKSGAAERTIINLVTKEFA